MGWGNVIAAGAGLLASESSGGSSGPPSGENARTGQINDIIGNNLQTVLSGRTNAINQATQIQVDALRNSLGPLLGGISRAGGILRNGFGTARGEITEGNQNAQNILAPIIASGDQANNILTQIASEANDPSFFQFDENDPGFQFLVRRGNEAINAGANARGLLNDGGRLRELAQFNQDRANTFRGDEIRNRANILNARLATVAPKFTAGINARGQSSQLANLLGQQLSGLTIDQTRAAAGNARAAGSAQSGILRQIANVQSRGLLNAADSELDGVLTTINALSGLEGVTRGNSALNLQASNIARQQAAQDAAAVGQFAGNIFEAFANRNSSGGGNNGGAT